VARWNRAFEYYKQWGWAQARKTEAPYARAYSQFTYAFGGHYLNEAYLRGENRAVRNVFEVPPSSTREIMAGYGARGSYGFPEAPNEVGQPVLPAEYELLATRHLGAWLFEVFNEFGTNLRAFSAYSDSGFTGDVLSIFRGPTPEHVTAVWRLRFDGPDQAAALASRAQSRDWTQVLVRQRDAIVVASTDERVPATLLDGMRWTAAPALDSKAPDETSGAAPDQHSILCLARN
jgi:hypothetical protein